MHKLKLHLFQPQSVLLILLILFHLAFNTYWQQVNKAPPTWDSAGHLTIAYIFAHKLPELVTGRMPLQNFIKVSTYYPPLVQILGGIFFLLFGFNYHWAFLLETLFLILAIIFLYKIICYHFNDSTLALLTVTIFSFFPHVWQQSREFHLDVPLVALLLASYYYLIKSNSLKNFKNSFLFFMFFALGQLTKWYGFVFLIVPFIYEVAVPTFKMKDYANKSRIQNVLVGSVIVLIGALPWYILNAKDLITTVGITSGGDAGDPLNVWSLESFFHYLELIMSHQITFVAVLLLFLAIFLFARKKVSLKNRVLNFMLFPYIIFTLIQNKDLRYVLPLTPIFAFYIAYMFLRIKFVFSRVVLYVFLSYLIITFFFLSLNQLARFPNWLKFYTYTLAGPYYSAWLANPMNYSYNAYDWKNDAVLQILENDTAALGSKPSTPYKVLTLSENQFFSVASFGMYRWQHEYFDLDIVTPFYVFNPFSPEGLKNYLVQMQYAVVPDNPGPSGLRNIAVLNQLITYFKSDQKDFSAIGSVTLPDNNVITVYKRTSNVAFLPTSLREDSLKIDIGNILYLDREKTEGLIFNVYLYDGEGRENLVVVSGGGAQRRIPLGGYDKVRIDLPLDQQNIQDMYGWNYVAGVFVRDPNYGEVLTTSNNVFIYDVTDIVPKSQYPSADKYVPIVTTAYSPDAVKISLTSTNPTDKVFIAYATLGWQWSNLWLDQGQREISIPVDGLLQLEITQTSQSITGFPSNWSFFKCYDGRAVCFYPPVANL